MVLKFIWELHSDLDDYTLKVRVIRLWNFTAWEKPQDIRGLGMILLDEQGDKIECNIEKPHNIKWQKVLQEYGSFYIKNHTLSVNQGTLKYAVGEKKLYFNYNTIVSKAKDFDGPMNSFNFVNYQTILDNTVEPDFTFDVVGHVFRLFDLVRYPGKEKDKLKQNMILEDLSGLKMYVTLWDDYAKEIDDYVSTNPDYPCLILIIQCARAKYFKGRYHVNNTVGGTKLFINKDIEEIVSFRKNFLMLKGYDSSSTEKSIASSLMYSVRDEFLLKHRFYKICELHELDEGSSGIIIGAIKHVEDRGSWYYIGCTTCKTKVQKKDGSNPTWADLGQNVDQDFFACSKLKCKGKVISAEACFVVKIRVLGIGVVTLTLFDKEIKRILNISAPQLLDKQIQVGRPEAFPSELYGLIDKKFAFQVAVNVSQYGHHTRYYNIVKFTDSLDIISELDELEKKKQISEQAMTDDSTNFGFSDFPSQDTVNTKDSSSSFTDDNTPISARVRATATSPRAEISPLNNTNPMNDGKRKLIEVYDVDEGVSESATKPCDISVGERCDPVKKLLIPKQEK